MNELPLDQGIPRFKQNESRADDFVNGGVNTTWQTSGGTTMPSVAKLVGETQQLSTRVYYTTRAVMDLAANNPVMVADREKLALVTDDPVVANRGYWRWDAALSVRVKTNYQVATDVQVKKAETVANGAALLAARPSIMNAEFHSNRDSDKATILATDKNGKALMAIDKSGFPINPLRAEFHSNRDSADTAVFSLTVNNGVQVVRVDKNLQLINRWQGEFHSNSDDPRIGKYSHVDDNLVIISSWTDDGTFVIGAGSSTNFGSLPQSEQHVNTGAPWLDNLSVSVRRQYNDLYTRSIASMFSTSTAVYTYLDSLMAANADYISKVDLGVDMAGRPIYQYTMSSPRLQTGTNDTVWHANNLAAPKIVILGGVHGNEREAVLSNIILMTEICNLWRQDEMLAALRFECDLVWVPILNPSGYRRDRRQNDNDVDLNTEANSETPQLETIIANGLPAAHPRAIAFIDHHNAYSFETADRNFWLGTRKLDTLGVCIEIARQITQYSQQEFDFWPQDNRPMARVTKNRVGSIAQRWQDTAGVDGYLCETPRESAFSLLDLRRFNSNCLKRTIFAILQRELISRKLSMVS